MLEDVGEATLEGARVEGLDDLLGDLFGIEHRGAFRWCWDNSDVG